MPIEIRYKLLLLVLLVGTIGILGLLLIFFLIAAWRRYSRRQQAEKKYIPVKQPDLWKMSGERLIITNPKPLGNPHKEEDEDDEDGDLPFDIDDDDDEQDEDDDDDDEEFPFTSR